MKLYTSKRAFLKSTKDVMKGNLKIIIDAQKLLILGSGSRSARMDEVCNLKTEAKLFKFLPRVVK